jgi:hypothetical protein
MLGSGGIVLEPRKVMGKQELENHIRAYLFAVYPDNTPWDRLLEVIPASPEEISEALYYLEYIGVVRIQKAGKCPGCVSLRSVSSEQTQIDPWKEIRRLEEEIATLKGIKRNELPVVRYPNGDRNLQATIRDFLLAHPASTREEVAYGTGLSITEVDNAIYGRIFTRSGTSWRDYRFSVHPLTKS